MKRFHVTVTRTDEYIIEVDEAIYNEEWKKDFEEHFFNVRTLEDVASHLAQYQARFSDHDFIEGFGYVKRDGKLPFSLADYDGYGDLLPRSKRRRPVPGLNIIIKSEDNQIEIDVEEIKPKPGISKTITP